MTKIQIQQRLEFWLRAQTLEVEIVGPAELVVMLGNGSAAWQCRILCEDAPLTIHYLSRLPDRVPEHMISGLAIRLLDLNRGVRFGQFSLDSHRRTITFRLTQMLRTDCPLAAQFYEAMTLSHHIMITKGRELARMIRQLDRTPRHRQGAFQCN